MAENEALQILQFSEDNWSHLMWYALVTVIIIQKQVHTRVGTSKTASKIKPRKNP